VAAPAPDDDIHVIEVPPPAATEIPMKPTLTHRLLSLSLASVFTLAMLASVGELFLGDEAQQANLAQRSTASAPRA
jgi:hypothetical protein